MKIILPDNLNDITLKDYISFMELDPDDENYEDLIFTLFTGIENVNDVSKKDYDNILKHVYNALQQEGQFKRTFSVGGVDLGIIPNFDKITGGEYSDLVKYSSTEVDGHNENLDRLIAVLYRPIIKTDNFGNYKIEKYKGTSGHLEQINKLPMSVVNGCLGFFLNLSNDLEDHIQKFTRVELAKV
jgi:hypothetical protein